MREAARRTQCTNNIRQVGLAVSLHVDHHNRLPALQMPAFHQDDRDIGWRLSILPHLEKTAIYETLRIPRLWREEFVTVAEDETSPFELGRTAIVGAFDCPSTPTSTPPSSFRTIIDTNTDEVLYYGSGPSNSIAPFFISWVEPKTRTADQFQLGAWWGRKSFGAFVGDQRRPQKEFEAYQRNAIQTGAKLSFIRDGLSKTALLAESAGGQWLYWGIIPGKAFSAISIDPTRPLMGPKYPSSVRTNHRGINICHCDGSVRFVTPDVSLQAFAAMLSRDDQRFERIH